jgi:Na+-transporting NADH:ubiquinone oxidoreductase subunit NqrB
MDLLFRIRAGAGALARRLPADPRIYQITVLGTLLAYGLTALHFEVGPTQAVVTIGAALLVQWLCTRLTRMPAFDPRSALISALSLCLLLRSPSLGAAAAAAAIAVGSKFVLRWNGKHLFNPTNFALVILITSGAAWVSPGQWGSPALFAFGIACLGTLVVTRAARADVTLAFLAAHAAILFGYAAWLGQPAAVPLHRMQSGALLLFAFFMISDPKTTPDARLGRVVFAVLVALGAAFVQFALYRTNGLLWSLAACSLFTPLIDRLLPGPRYAWRRTHSRPGRSTGGDSRHETVPLRVPAGARAAVATPGR